MARRRRYRPAYRRNRRGIPVGRYVFLFLALATAIWWMLPSSSEDAEIGDTESVIASSAAPESKLLAATKGDGASDDVDLRDRKSRRERRRQLGQASKSSERGTASAGEAAKNVPVGEVPRAESMQAAGGGASPQLSTPVSGDAGTPSQAQLVSNPSDWLQRFRAGEQAQSSGDLIAARSHFSAAMLAGATGEKRMQLRGLLTEIGNQTIFSNRLMKGDTLVERYTIRTGDSLGKIAKKYQITPELIASINGIQNMNMIRAGQDIKVIRGPFRALVYKSDHGMDLYLGDTYARHYPVGLGADDGTPTGKWKVGTKLVNPTYYPPRGGKIIAADDPENPLGEHWIALHGIDGDAVGATRYGIHGTIEEESIGRDASMGCIRMYNTDVAVVYTLLVKDHSIIEVLN
ncbi:MAG: L,D-transpeptidase family protein [Phycisphaerae bacterium]